MTVMPQYHFYGSIVGKEFIYFFLDLFDLIAWNQLESPISDLILSDN